MQEPSRYKLHFARHNRIEQPLDVFVRSREEWQGWQEYRPKRNQFNRRYIFSVIDSYREPDIWLFGGVWEVLERLPDNYVVALTDQDAVSLSRYRWGGADASGAVALPAAAPILAAAAAWARLVSADPGHCPSRRRRWALQGKFVQAAGRRLSSGHGLCGSALLRGLRRGLAEHPVRSDGSGITVWAVRAVPSRFGGAPT